MKAFLLIQSLVLLLLVTLVTTDRSLATTASQPSRNYLINLYDSYGPNRPELQKDWGYSALIEYNGKRILFDSGNNADVFKKNVQALGIDLKKVDFAILSHSHLDHLSGFDYVFTVNPKLKLYVPDDGTLGGDHPMNIGGPQPEAKNKVGIEERYFGDGPQKIQLHPSSRWWNRDVVFVKTNTSISDGITLITTQSPYLGYSNSYPPNDKSLRINPLPELSLSLKTSKGETLIVGCSHSGVENIVKATRDHLKTNVYQLIGGFHTLPYDQIYIERLAHQIKDELGVQKVAPAHCTGHIGFRAFHDVYGDQYTAAGLGTILSLPE